MKDPEIAEMASMYLRTLMVLAWVSCVNVAFGQTVAPITVEGITDRAYDNYNDHVSFRVPSANGYTYDVKLDGSRAPTDVWLDVKTVDYHEVAVWRTNLMTGDVANRLVRFIIQSSERSADGSTENGLPPWTPYPVINSAPGELAGAHLDLITPRSYPAGWEIPVVAWLRDSNGGQFRACGLLAADGQAPIQVFRGAGSGFLATSNLPMEMMAMTYAPELAGVHTTRTINLETNVAWTNVQGSLTGNVSWPEGSRILVNGHLQVPAGSTLNIGAGTIVALASRVNITNSGRIVINGSVANPVVFTPANGAPFWGGFYLPSSTSELTATGTIFTRSGGNPGAGAGHRSEQCLFLMDNHSRLALTDCAAIYLAGQFGHGYDRGTPWISVDIRRSLIQRCITGGEWNGTSLKFLQSALIEVPYATPVFNNGDEDGIYFTTGQFEVRDSLIGWTRDDGIDSGSGGSGSVTVSNTWIESTYHEAFAWSGGGRTTTNLHTVCLNCGQGIECGWSNSANSPSDFVDGCLSTANLIGARFGDNYNWTFNGFLRVTNSILLHNYRDVWGMNWQENDQGWIYRTNAMDIQGNFLTASNRYHPLNAVWDPTADGWRLAEFMPTACGADVGMGLAVWTNRFAMADILAGVPVRLSTFTTNWVSVDYVFEGTNGPLATGSLTFAPGETVKRIAAADFDAAAHKLVRVVLQNPVRAEFTGITNVVFEGDITAPQVFLMTGSEQKDIARISEGVALGLNNPSTAGVAVSYRWEMPGGAFANGQIRFQPGQTLCWLAPPPVSIDTGVARLVLTGVTGGELSSPAELYFVRAIPEPVPLAFTLVSSGSLWRYLDSGVNLGLPWSASNPGGWTGPAFDDSQWPIGRAIFGYGNDGIETTTNYYGGNSSKKYITYYYRHEFAVTNAAEISNLSFSLLRDDGAVVYLNGAEVYRENMPQTVITNLTLASTNYSGTPTAYNQRTFAASALAQPLHNGTNILAVEIHQSNAGSSDIIFDLETSAEVTPAATGGGQTIQIGTFNGQPVLLWGGSNWLLYGATNALGPWTRASRGSPARLNPARQQEFFRLQRP